jgi:hypothetical protein
MGFVAAAKIAEKRHADDAPGADRTATAVCKRYVLWFMTFSKLFALHFLTFELADVLRVASR